MTDYFKKTLLQWVTGDYTYGTRGNDLVYSTTSQATNNLQQQLDTKFVDGYEITLKFQPVNANNQGIGYTILCGKELTNNGGFIVILDTNFNILSILTEYTSGVKFGDFIAMNTDEKGQYFAIENQNNNVRRLVLLNNITAITNGEYKASIRTAYNLQTNQSKTMTISGIIKAENTGKYLIYGKSNTQVLATEFTINVGSENEWVDYASPGDRMDVTDCWANWDADNKLTFKMVGYYYSDNNIQLAEAHSQENTQIIQVDQYSIGIKGDLMSFDAKIINENDVYYAFYDYTPTDKNIVIMYLDLMNSTLSRIYRRIPDYSTSSDNNGIELFKNLNEVFIHQFLENEDKTFAHYIGRIYYTDNFSINQIATTNLGMSIKNPFMVVKQFNLYNYYLQDINTVYNQYQVFNENNYNGEPYNGTEPLSPVSGRLYHNDIVVFARNLYNIVVNGNTTTSTLEVPNTFVNEIEITPKELWGESNQTLVSDTDSITTNIYETLLINYINTINMSNQNDPNNIIINNTGASGLNLGLRYSVSQTRIEVLRINYEDGTKLENTLNPTKIDDTHYNYTFPIFVSKAIKNIQFMTNYEKALGDVYLELDGSVYEVGKAYTISQNVRVE